MSQELSPLDLQGISGLAGHLCVLPAGVNCHPHCAVTTNYSEDSFFFHCMEEITLPACWFLWKEKKYQGLGSCICYCIRLYSNFKSAVIIQIYLVVGQGRIPSQMQTLQSWKASVIDDFIR